MIRAALGACGGPSPGASLKGPGAKTSPRFEAGGKLAGFRLTELASRRDSAQPALLDPTEPEFAAPGGFGSCPDPSVARRSSGTRCLDDLTFGLRACSPDHPHALMRVSVGPQHVPRHRRRGELPKSPIPPHSPDPQGDSPEAPRPLRAAVDGVAIAAGALADDSLSATSGGALRDRGARRLPRKWRKQSEMPRQMPRQEVRGKATEEASARCSSPACSRACHTICFQKAMRSRARLLVGDPPHGLRHRTSVKWA